MAQTTSVRKGSLLRDPKQRPKLLALAAIALAGVWFLRRGQQQPGILTDPGMTTPVEPGDFAGGGGASGFDPNLAPYPPREPVVLDPGQSIYDPENPGAGVLPAPPDPAAPASSTPAASDPAASTIPVYNPGASTRQGGAAGTVSSILTATAIRSAARTVPKNVALPPTQPKDKGHKKTPAKPKRGSGSKIASAAGAVRKASAGPATAPPRSTGAVAVTVSGAKVEVRPGAASAISQLIRSAPTVISAPKPSKPTVLPNLGAIVTLPQPVTARPPVVNVSQPRRSVRGGLAD